MVASRRRSTYWVRTGAALLVIIAGTWLFLMMQNDSPKDIALALFCTMTGGAVLYALLSGVRVTADCLSEEKREGTLGLLFLTDLKGYDVVIGKLMASSMNAFYSVLAIVPVSALPLLLGGLTPGEFGRMALVAVNTLLFSLSIGLLVSSLSRSAQKAAATTLFLLIIFNGLLPACGLSLAVVGKTVGIKPIFLLPSAGFSFFQALDSQYIGDKKLFWYSVGLLHLVTWCCLGLASLIAPHSWQERPAGVRRLRWRERCALWLNGDAIERRTFRTRLLEQNAFYWLSARVRARPAYVWAFMALVACFWVWGLAKFRRDWLGFPVYGGTALLLNGALRYWFAAESVRQLGEERKAGTLELLLSTPLSVPEILGGQALALSRQFLGPVLLTLALETTFLLAVPSDISEPDDRALWFSAGTAFMLMLVADIVAMHWLGMWLALTAKNTNRAGGACLVRILFVPWCLIAIVMLMLVLGAVTGIREPEPGWKFFLGLWFCLGVGTDVVYAVWARHKLLHQFRLAAQTRFTAPRSWWRNLLSGSALEVSNTGRVSPAAK